MLAHSTEFEGNINNLLLIITLNVFVWLKKNFNKMLKTASQNMKLIQSTVIYIYMHPDGIISNSFNILIL